MPRHGALDIMPAIILIIFAAAWCQAPTPPPDPPAPATSTPWRAGPSTTPRPIYPLSTTSSWSIAGAARDSYDDGTSNYSTAKFAHTGQATSELTGGLQFASIGIPAGNVAISATVSINVTATTGTSSWRIYGEAADSCSNWTSRNPRDVTKTTAYVDWTPGAGTGRKYKTGIQSIITEIITRPGWAGGNLCLVIFDNQASNNQFQTWATYDYNSDASYTARLDVEYDAPTATPTVTQTPTHTATPTITPTPTVTTTPTPCSYIIADTTWTGVYTVTCNVAVPTAQVLTITAGADIRFAGPYKIDVYGALRALGTAAQPITLTSSTTTTGRNAWGPLTILRGGRADVAFATIRNARSVDVDGATFITSTTLSTNTIGLHFTYPGSVASSTLTYNTTGILLQQNTQPAITSTNISALNNTTAIDNRQPLTITLTYLYWYTTTGTLIDAAVTDQLDDYRLGPVIWSPIAETPY